MKTEHRLLVLISVLLSLAAAGCGSSKAGAGADDDDGSLDIRVLVSVSPNPAMRWETVTIDASASEGNIESYRFVFGDGSPVVTQNGPVTTHAYDVQNAQDTTYTIKVRGYANADDFVEAQVQLLVKDIPPQVTGVESGADKRGVIGEWILVEGENFTTQLIPTITVDGVPATAVEILDAQNLRFRVPPTARAGVRPLSITFPGGYAPFNVDLDVRRFALVTSARYDQVFVLDVNPDESITDTGVRLDIGDASVVKLSPDGSTAYVDDGRFAFLSTGTITIVDLTADGQPVIHDSFTVGLGPLFDIEVSHDARLLVAGDAFGIHVFDVRFPLDPVLVGYTSALFAGDPTNDIAACDIAISPNGTKTAVLNALNPQARIFNHNPQLQITNGNDPVRVDVGPKTQDAVISRNGATLFVLGGGGEGAFPPDFTDPTAANLTAVSLSGGSVIAGPIKLSDLNGGQAVAPIPFDLVVSNTDPNKVFVTSLDEPFSELFDLLDAVVNDFSLENLLNLIVFLAADGMSFGHTLAITNANTTSPVLGIPMQETFTAPTSADLLYNDHRMLQSSFRLWYDDGEGEFVFQTGATVIDLTGGGSTFLPFATETLGFDAVFGLLQPPLSFGDAVFQP